MSKNRSKQQVSSFTDARLGKPQAEELQRYVTSAWLTFARSAYREFCLVDMAHTVMLNRQGVLAGADTAKILTCLARIWREGPDQLPFDGALGSYLFQVEAWMAGEIGEETAGRMHTGRSRNDQDTCVQRLLLRDRLLGVAQAIIEYQERIIAVAREHAATLMPGYTHLQHAQPVTLGHHFTGEFFVSSRDFHRLQGAFAHTNLNSLGGAALAGTGWPVDREQTASYLGFDGLVLNSRDASGTANEYTAEIAAALSILMVNLGRVASDLYVWSSWEFDLIELADEFCGSSSIMPQKKNPYLLERARGLAGEAIGLVPALLGSLKMATTSDRDAGFSDGADVILPNACTTACNTLEMIGKSVQTMTVKKEVMRRRAGAFWSTASNLADEIVRQKGLSFRSAHQVVARLVRNAIAGGVAPAAVTSEMLDAAAAETVGRPVGMSAELIRQALDPEEFLRTRASAGSVNPVEVLRMVEEAERIIAEEKAWLADRTGSIKVSLDRLGAEVGAYLGEPVTLTGAGA